MVSPMFGIEGPHLELVREAFIGYDSSFLEAVKQRWAPLQWTLLVAAVLLLVLENTEWRSPLLVGLLVPLIFINAPNLVFDFFRGYIGQWFAFIIVLGVLYTPSDYIPAPTNLWASILLLIVVAPAWIVSLRFTIWGVIISLIIAAVLATQHVLDANNDPEGPQSTFTHQRRLPTTLALILTIVIPIFFFFF